MLVQHALRTPPPTTFSAPFEFCRRLLQSDVIITSWNGRYYCDLCLS